MGEFVGWNGWKDLNQLAAAVETQLGKRGQLAYIVRIETTHELASSSWTITVYHQLAPAEISKVLDSTAEAFFRGLNAGFRNPIRWEYSRFEDKSGSVGDRHAMTIRKCEQV